VILRDARAAPPRIFRAISTNSVGARAHGRAGPGRGLDLRC
jgi:hypothetical protein